MNNLIVSADDYGLTRATTDTILEAADHGTLTSVSVLANGLAVDYALAEFGKRKERLRLAVHLNLTEGRALSAPAQIPRLVDQHGMFRHTPFSLLWAYIFASHASRTALCREIAVEFSAQWKRVQDNAPVYAADGHQHVQMLPFVFDEVLRLPKVSYVRITSEPFYLMPRELPRYVSLHAFSRIVFLWLGNVLRKRARERGVEAPKYVLGFLFSGRISFENISAGMHQIANMEKGAVELIFHPGTAQRQELAAWGTEMQRSWYLSPMREKERTLLTSLALRALLERFSRNSLPEVTDYGRVIRFIVAGGFVSVLNLGLLYAFTSWLHIWYVSSAFIAYVISLAASFTVQKFWTFRHASFSSIIHQLPLYGALQTINLIVATYGLYLLVEYTHMWYLLASALLMLAAAVWNFFISKNVIFRHHKTI